MPPKASVHSVAQSIRAKSKNKQKLSQKSGSNSADPFGSSSLASLLKPTPHGKDAALASLLASTSKTDKSKPSTDNGLMAFSLSSLTTKQETKDASQLSLLDQREKEKATSHSSQVKNQVQKGMETNSTQKGLTTKPIETIASASSSNAPSPKPLSQKPTPEVSAIATATATATPSPPTIRSEPVATVPAGRKPVFRPVLTSSMMVSWPELPVAGSKAILHTLLDLLRSDQVKPLIDKDLGRNSTLKTKRRKVKKHDQKVQETQHETRSDRWLIAGINSVSRALQERIQSTMTTSLQTKGKRKASDGESELHQPNQQCPSHIRIVFVCRQDIDPSSLISHFPMLTCSYNAVYRAHSTSSSLQDGLLLVPLPSGSDSLICSALELHRCAVLALTNNIPQSLLEPLFSSIQRASESFSTLSSFSSDPSWKKSNCLVHSDWIDSAVQSSSTSSSSSCFTHSFNQIQLDPTTIKLLRTTQPIDLNACKNAKKLKRKQRSQLSKQIRDETQKRIKSKGGVSKAVERVRSRQQRIKSASSVSSKQPS